MPSKSGQTIDSEIEAQKQIDNGIWWATFLKDYKITIDGHNARVLEHQIQVPEIDTSLMLERRIYIAIKSQIYEIIYKVAVKDHGGEFDQGYEYFFKSLKIVP